MKGKCLLRQRFPDGIIFLASIFLFCLGLMWREYIHPEILYSNDYYQYIESGKNIFNNLNFTVEGQLGENIACSPLYPLLTRLLTFLTKDPLVSMQWINCFSVSFLIIPLFFLTKSLFNKTLAFMVSGIAIFILPLLYPLNHPRYDYLFIFLTVTASCLTWKISSGHLKRASFVILDGFLICLAYLTKAIGITYCLMAIFSLYYLGIKSAGYPLRHILKKIILLLLGFLPLVLFYKVSLLQASIDKEVCEHGVRVFLIGNYAAGSMGEREEKLYQLNKDGDEFNFLLECKRTSIFLSCLKQPGFIVYKYRRGLKRMLDQLHFVFVSSICQHLNNFFKSCISVFLVSLALLAVSVRENRRNIFYILLWLTPSLGIPFILLTYRYLWPFIFFYLILFIAGGYNLFTLSRRNRYLRWTLIIIYFVFLSRYILISVDTITHEQERFPANEEYKKAALWVKEDAQGLNRRLKIMARKTIFSYLADAQFIALPYEESWERIINFAWLKRVDYIALDSRVLSSKRPYRYSGKLFQDIPVSKRIKLVYQDERKSNQIFIYKIIR